MNIYYKELGSLKQIADALWRDMIKEAETNGYSDLTLGMEGAARGIYEIIEINKINEIRVNNDRP